jgi:hypothetical protein
VGGAAEGVGETTERVRAEKEVSGAGRSGEKETEIFETRTRYPSRDRKTPGKFWVSDTGWVTPKVKKRAGKSGYLEYECRQFVRMGVLDSDMVDGQIV